MALEASEVAVRVRLLGGSAFQTEADRSAAAMERLNAAGSGVGKGTAAAAGGTALMGNNLERSGKSIDRVGRSITNMARAVAPLSLGLGYIGFKAASANSQFQRLMATLVTQANLPRKNVQALTSDIMKLSTATAQTPQALAAAAYRPISHGVYNPKEITKDLMFGAMLAQVGGDTVENTQYALQAAKSAFPSMSMNRIANLFHSAIAEGSLHMPDLTQSFATGVLPMMKVAHASLGQMLASMDALTRVGVPASQVMSRMRLTLTSMKNPTKIGATSLADLGLSQYALANDMAKGPQGFLTALADLANRQNRFGDNLAGHNRWASDVSAIFGRSRGAAQIEGLVEELYGPQGIFHILGVLNKQASTNFLQSSFKYTQGTSSYKYQKIQAQYEQAMVNLGGSINRDLLPQLMKFVIDIEAGVHWLGQLPAPLKKILTYVGAGIVAFTPIAFIVGGAMSAIGKLVHGFGILLRWTGILATADKAAAGEQGVGGLSTAIKGSGLIANLVKLGGVAAVAGAGYEAYTHRKQIGHFIAGAEGNTIAGNFARSVWDWLQGGAYPHANTPAEYNRLNYIKSTMSTLQTFGENPHALSNQALADPHFAEMFGKAMGETFARYLEQHPDAKLSEHHSHVYIDGKKVMSTVDKHHRGRHNRG